MVSQEIFHMKVESLCASIPSSGSKRSMIRVGVIGYGYWGPNIVRNFHGLENARVDMVCDKSPAALARVRKTYPNILTTTDPNEVLHSTQIDTIAVITPVWTHY